MSKYRLSQDNPMTDEMRLRVFQSIVPFTHAAHRRIIAASLVALQTMINGGQIASDALEKKFGTAFWEDLHEAYRED